MGAGAIVAIALMIASSFGGYVAVDQGYIPVKDLVGTGLSTLKAVSPPGDYIEVTAAQVKEKYPAIAEKIATQMPHYNDILIRMYMTNATLDETGAYYNSFLTGQGFTCKTSGHLDIGNIEPLGIIPIYYYGYEKGFTASGVVMTDYVTGKVLVLYTTGYASYYSDIIPWIEQQKVATPG
jgi:hypothetical protein